MHHSKRYVFVIFVITLLCIQKEITLSKAVIIHDVQIEHVQSIISKVFFIFLLTHSLVLTSLLDVLYFFVIIM